MSLLLLLTIYIVYEYAQNQYNQLLKMEALYIEMQEVIEDE